MRVDCETWIYTTLKETNVSSEEQNVPQDLTDSLSSEPRAILFNNDDLIIEQKIQLDQQIYSDGSSDNDNDNELENKKFVCTKIANHKGFDINVELINNGSFKNIKMVEPDISKSNLTRENLASSSMSSDSPSYINCVSIPIIQEREPSREYSIQESIQMTLTWESFQQLLNNCLDCYTLRDSIEVIEECIKLENYLNSEFQLNEKDLYFSNQKQIIDYLNITLKKKLFSLSQSSELFRQHKKELLCVLTSKLSPATLSEVLSNFEQLEKRYHDLLESIKSRLKLKLAKLENNLHVWNEFDALCQKLNKIFDTNSGCEQSNLQYRSLLIEINDSLDNLKEYHSLLSSTCNESKYFEMKNFIILYELKLSRLRESHEAAVNNQEFYLKYFTKSNEYEENVYYENQNSHSPKNNQSDKIIDDERWTPCQMNKVCDTSYRTTPHEVPVSNEKYYSEVRSNDENVKLRQRNRNLSTNNVYTKTPSTEKLNTRPRSFFDNRVNFDCTENYNAPSLKKVETSDKSTFTINEMSTQTEQYLNDHQIFSNQYTSKNYSKNSRKHLTGSPETDGKTLLLEAYLRNNDNLVHNENSHTSQIGSSRSSTSLLPNALNKPNTKRKSLTLTTGTRESGIGTYIDDEIGTSSCELEFVKTNSSDKKIDYQTDHESLSKINDNSSTNELFYISNASKKCNSKTVKSRSVKRNELSKQSYSIKVNKARTDKSSSETISKTLYSPIASNDENKTFWFSWFFKTIFKFLLFFLTIIFVIFVYFFYSIALNPSCCDYQRNYLMFNIS